MKRLAGRAGKLDSRIAAWSSLLWFYVRSSKWFTLMLALALAALWTAACFVGGYYYSQRDFNQLMAGFEQMSRRYNLPYEGVTWAARFSALQRRTEVSDKAVEEIKRYLYEKNEQLKELEEHLYFYRTVIAPEDEEKGLAVFSVNLRRSEDAQAYPVEVVLRNHHSKKGAVKGRIKILVEGEAEARGPALVRDDLLEGEIRFSFKYFQRLNGILRLPERFSPRRLSVVIAADRFEETAETYAWAALLERGR